MIKFLSIALEATTGILIEGFDELSTFEEQYNFSYYQKLIENYGFDKEVDWEERKLYFPETDKSEKIRRISNKLISRYKLHIGTAKNTSEFLKKYGDQIFDVLDKTYSPLYGTVPFNESTKKMILSTFKLVLFVYTSWSCTILASLLSSYKNSDKVLITKSIKKH